MEREREKGREGGRERQEREGGGGTGKEGEGGREGGRERSVPRRLVEQLEDHQCRGSSSKQFFSSSVSFITHEEIARVLVSE